MVKFKAAHDERGNIVTAADLQPSICFRAV
jgi:hypothetical protein